MTVQELIQTLQNCNPGYGVCVSVDKKVGFVSGVKFGDGLFIILEG